MSGSACHGRGERPLSRLAGGLPYPALTSVPNYAFVAWQFCLVTAGRHHVAVGDDAIGVIGPPDGVVRVGLVGCGKISDAYLTAGYPNVTYVACADLDATRAQATAEKYGLQAIPVSDLLSDGDIQVVCNLTVPRAHAQVSSVALQNGKHVYGEKPLGLDREEGASCALADEHGLAIGCAPDTFLGAGLQTCRRVIDEGRIGVPVAAIANMVSHGPEHWHPDPAFFYQPGGGRYLTWGRTTSRRWSR